MEPLTRCDWQQRQPVSELDPDEIARSFGISRLAAEIVLRRGAMGEGDIRHFLAAKLSDLPDPDGLPGMRAASERVARAVRDGAKILVHGDYDVDGITGTTLLLEFLGQCGADVDYFIPHRLQDGYGLSAQALENAAASGVRVVLSVDCGISACAEGDLASELGIDLVITDHHQPPPVLPRACARPAPGRLS